MPKAILEAGHAACPLIDAIVALGEAVDWQEARKEWELAEVFFAERDQPGTCLCGHAPIIEHCVLLNRKNGNRAVVGNVCVKRFMGLPSGKLFEAFARIMAKRDAALNAATVEYAHGKGWINNWERGFCLDTCRKRKLTERQRAKREEINPASCITSISRGNDFGGDGMASELLMVQASDLDDCCDSCF